MKKTTLTAGVITLVASSLMFNSCIGSFALTNKVLAWNKQVSNKFVNELVFVAFWILPVYELSAIADLLVINSIEFWSGDNPVTDSAQVVKLKDTQYQIKTSKEGYTITNLKDKSVVKLDFNQMDKSWAIEMPDGEKKVFMQYVDDDHVKMPMPDGSFQTFEISEQGVMAYSSMVKAPQSFYAAR